MKNIWLVLVFAFATVASAIAESDRYVILDKTGVYGVEWSEPSYSTAEGKKRICTLQRVSASKWNGRSFYNENSKKKCAITCEFTAGKSAVVFVDENGEPVYLEGCLGGTFYNRIKLIQREVRHESPPPAPRPIVREQVVYEEMETHASTGVSFGESEHSMEFEIQPQRRYCTPRMYFTPPRPQVRHCPPPRPYIRPCPPPRQQQRYCTPHQNVYVGMRYPAPIAAPGWRGSY